MKNTIEATKVCKKCNEDKPLSEYNKRKGAKDGHRNDCKACVKAKNKAHYEANHERILAEQKAYREANREKRNASMKAYREANRKELAAQARAYYAANREERNASMKAYREANREEIAASERAYREANREKLAALEKAYREANREKIAARKKAYYEANREKLNAANKSRHSERYSNDPEYRAKVNASNLLRKRLQPGAKQEPYIREEIFARDNWICGLCQEPIDPELKWPESGFASIDHIVPISLGGDDTPANVQAAHLRCNISKGNRVELEDLQAA